MSKLMRANFVRLVKSKVFWVCLAGLVIFAAISFVGNNEGKNAAESFFGIAMMLSMLFAAFCPLFIGTEYGDGTIRNKLVIGHTRTAVYVSNLLTCILANIIMLAVYGAAIRIVSWVVQAEFSMPWKIFLGLCAAEIMMIVALTALLLLFSMLNQNKAVVVAASLVIVFGGMLASSYIANCLNSEEYVEMYYEKENGEIQSETLKNSMYLQPEERKYYQFAFDALPFGQGLQIGSSEVENPGLLMLYSSVWTILSTGAGIFFFRRKDIK